MKFNPSDFIEQAAMMGRHGIETREVVLADDRFPKLYLRDVRKAAASWSNPGKPVAVNSWSNGLHWTIAIVGRGIDLEFQAIGREALYRKTVAALKALKETI